MQKARIRSGGWRIAFAAFGALLFSTSGAIARDPQVCFTPGEDCTGIIVDQVTSARREVLVQAYSFTSPEIVKALAAAKRRGTDVRVILDKSNTCRDGGDCEKKGAIAADTLSIAKATVLVDRRHAIAHNKIIIIDGQRAITGSFNFTRAAQDKNAENLIIIQDEDLARKYRTNWMRHADHSERYE
ncbi:phospholipase D family nuclease [Paramagnetospirillum magnetotacticum]|uniref:phospholipase D family nuclease n=1 Tax=Paramagnetospirillum magnetotacticum TaxID=188 RepID=UPI00069648A1|nr:phospholipase D family protein [Paramagnetospirillum magnetotacticum]